MKPGTITATSAGTLQGIYRPQARLYYFSDRHGIVFETITKPVRCRSRKRAIALAKEWIKTPEFAEEIAALKERLAKHDGVITA